MTKDTLKLIHLAMEVKALTIACESVRLRRYQQIGLFAASWSLADYEIVYELLSGTDTQRILDLLEVCSYYRTTEL